MSLLSVPYALNILILAPVCLAMFSGNGQAAVFQGRVAASGGLELLVGSLWLAILAGSAVGIFLPERMAPLLAVQIFYKAAWLLAFVAPAVARDGWSAAPIGITICFALIVLIWPFFLARAWA